jgi:hypothetical protein
MNKEGWVNEIIDKLPPTNFPDCNQILWSIVILKIFILMTIALPPEHVIYFLKLGRYRGGHGNEQEI